MKPLHPITLPLQGLQVIEASAGTGKTWTLAALYVRLVLGHGRHAEGGLATSAALDPPQILVMTFTDAATAELRARVRQRLAQAAQFFAGQPSAQHSADAFLHDLRAQFATADWGVCARRLDLAAQWMDEAAIFTIHGWSSRMLQQHAFDSAALFQQTRVEDDEALRLAAVQDYWRRWFYAPPAAQLGALHSLGSEPAALLRKLRPVWRALERSPKASLQAGPDPHVLLQNWEQWQARLQAQEALARRACTEPMLALLAQVVAAKTLKGYRSDWPSKLAQWAKGPPWLQQSSAQRKATHTLLQRFALGTLKEKGWGGAAGHALFGHIEALCAMLQQEPDVGTGLLQHAALQIGQDYARTKDRLAQFDFPDLLQRLYHALQADDGRLAAAIRQQFPVALVDEFQDTDPWQYGALARIYGQDASIGTALLMIGDPKQAIYGFRGADLTTYLEARQQAHGIYTLDGNYRSTPTLVAAINHVFARASQPFGTVPYLPVQARNPQVLPLLLQGVEQPAMTVWYQDLRPASRPLRKALLLRQQAHCFASQMVALLNAGAAVPGDMAVLVRSGDEARAMRQALAQRGVRSVYLSERDSVFATQEAQDLWRLLAAVARPQSVALLRAALATPLWGLPFDRLQAMFQDEQAWDALVEQFHAWQAVWQRQGLLPMLHRWLHAQGIAQRLLANGTAHDGERRLTNVLHLGELLQQASASLQGEGAVLRYLEGQLQNPSASGDAAQLRLESDAELVQLITIHKSKGLQYPLVFLPFISSFRSEPKDSGRDDSERLAEDMRLLYVALTRAERALWLGQTPVRGDLDGKTPKARSALSLLLGRRQPDDLAHCLQAWAACSHIVVAAAPAPTAQAYQPTVPAAPQYKPALQPQRLLESRWWSASFSALTRRLGLAGPVDASGSGLAADLPSARDARLADALVDNPRPADPPLEDRLQPAPPVPFNEFPAGSSYGTLLHDLLEWQFEHGWPVAHGAADSASAEPGAQELQAQWRSLLARKALRLQLYGQHVDRLTPWLQAIAQTPLPLQPLMAGLQGVQAGPHSAHQTPGARGPSLVLADLDRSRAWAEMGFALPVHALPASRLDALICQHLPSDAAAVRRPLQELQLQGMLVGFMDLVLEHGGRYFVLDYKSNRLAGYGPEQLQAAVLEHRYEVQYTLYTLALHRLLRSRLPDYDYERHVGGAIYLFTRGIDQPGSGLFLDRPPWALIQALDGAFSLAAEQPLGALP